MSDSSSEDNTSATLAPSIKKKMADARAKKRVQTLEAKLKDIGDDKRLREKEIEKLNKKADLLKKKYEDESAEAKKEIDDMRKAYEKALAEFVKNSEKKEKKFAENIGKLAEELDPLVEKVAKLAKEEEKVAKNIADATKPISSPTISPKPDSSSSDSESSTRAKTKRAIPKAIKTLVWNKYIGETKATAACVCCEVTEIKNTHFHCGHVVAEAFGGTLEISNLRPICAPCNLSMGTQNMDTFKATFGLGVTTRKKKE